MEQMRSQIVSAAGAAHNGDELSLAYTPLQGILQLHQADLI